MEIGCVCNVLIPKTLNLKIQQSKLIENYAQILSPEYLCMLYICMHTFQLSNYEFGVPEVLHILENV